MHQWTWSRFLERAMVSTNQCASSLGENLKTMLNFSFGYLPLGFGMFGASVLQGGLLFPCVACGPPVVCRKHPPMHCSLGLQCRLSGCLEL